MIKFNINQPKKDDSIVDLEHHFRVMDEVNRIFKNSFFGNININTNKMETRNISLTLEEAREWYNSNIILKDIALKAFTKEELEYSFKDIKTLEDACKALHLSYDAVIGTSTIISQFSKASAAMFKLNIIRKALNLGQYLGLVKDPDKSYVYYPCNQILFKGSNFYDKELSSGEKEIIGEIGNEGTLYIVLGGGATYGNGTGLGSFFYKKGIGSVCNIAGFLGCANREIAQHFGKYFGMLIISAMYSDLPDFRITISKYNI